MVNARKEVIQGALGIEKVDPTERGRLPEEVTHREDEEELPR